MYGTVAYSPVDQEVDGRNLRLFCSRVCAKAINVIPIVGYFVLLFWRFVGLFLYGVYTSLSVCSSDDQGNQIQGNHEEPLKNPTVGSSGSGFAFVCFNITSFELYQLIQIVAWLIASIVNTLFVILVLRKVPGYDGYLATLRKNAKEARFWSFFCQLLLSITYKCIIIIKVDLNNNFNTYSDTLFFFPLFIFFVMLFILEEIFTTLVVYFWNGVPAPWKNPRVPAKHWAYRLTLLVFLLEKFFLFVLSFFHAASIAGNLRNNNDFITAVLNAADATFLYSLTKFFWNKLFYGERNLLINDNV